MIWIPDSLQVCWPACVVRGWLVYLFSICRVFALDLVKLCNFQLESLIAQKIFGLQLADLQNSCVWGHLCPMDTSEIIMVNLKFDMYKSLYLFVELICCKESTSNLNYESSLIYKLQQQQLYSLSLM
jgi:hypothetical protein